MRRSLLADPKLKLMMRIASPYFLPPWLILWSRHALDLQSLGTFGGNRIGARKLRIQERQFGIVGTTILEDGVQYCAPVSRPCGCIRHPLFCRREVRRRKKIVSARVVKILFSTTTVFESETSCQADQSRVNPCSVILIF